MNIWIVKIGEPFPNDEKQRKMRNGYLTEKLIQKKHTLTWWTTTFDHFKKDWIYTTDKEIQISDKIIIKAFKGFKYKKNISLARVFDHWLISRKFKKAFEKEEKPDLIIANTPVPSHAYVAFCYAKKNNIPFIIDIRDLWPDIIIERIPIPNFLAKLFYYDTCRNMKIMMRESVGITAISNEYLRWGLNYAKRKKRESDRVFYLGYKKQLVKTPSQNFLSEYKNKFVITFLGMLGEVNNPLSIVESARELTNEKDIHFIVAGDGPLMNMLKNKAEGLKNITFTGFLQQDRISQLLQISNIGVCTSSKESFFFPTKAFIYSSAGLPILNSFYGELRNIIEEYNIGYNFSPGDFKTLSQHIIKLKNDRETYQKMANTSSYLFETELNSDKIYSNFASHIEILYERFVSERK